MQCGWFNRDRHILDIVLIMHETIALCGVVCLMEANSILAIVMDMHRTIVLYYVTGSMETSSMVVVLYMPVHFQNMYDLSIS